jgi:hypothetical protein
MQVLPWNPKYMKWLNGKLRNIMTAWFDRYFERKTGIARKDVRDMNHVRELLDLQRRRVRVSAMWTAIWIVIFIALLTIAVIVGALN